MAQGVTEEVDGAALPWGAEHLGDRGLEALVGVGDDQLDAGQAATDQRAQELAPERLGLGRAHIQADDLPLAAGIHPVGDHQGPMLDPSAGTDLLDLGVQPQYGYARSRGRSQKAVTCSSRPPHSRETVSLDTPASPKASTNRSTLRVDTPFTYASCTTATSACSLRRRGSRKLGKYDPERNLGMASSIDPTRVSQARSR